MVTTLETELRDIDTSAYLSQLQKMEHLWHDILCAPTRLEYLVSLGQLTHEMLQAVRMEGDSALTGLATRLNQVVSGCLAAGRSPRDEERGCFNSLINELRDTLSRNGTAHTDHTLPGDCKSAPTKTPEVYVIDERGGAQLIVELDQAGFQVRSYRSLAGAEAALTKRTPLATIVHTSPSGKGLEGVEMVSRLRQRILLETPVFFISDQDAFDTRLAAIRAGGAGFFPEPVDYQALLDTLSEWILLETEQSARLLVIDEQPEKAQAMAKLLRNQGFTAHIETKSTQLVETVLDFRPNLIVIDIDFTIGSALETIQFLRQHHASQGLPVILLAGPDSLSEALPQLRHELIEPLVKPVLPHHLSWLVRQRLRQSYLSEEKLRIARHRDEVSRVFNRHHFLIELERSVSTLRNDSPPPAVMLILIENWLAVRKKLGIDDSDEILGRVARRMRRILGFQHELARFGDAIFAVRFENPDPESLMNIARAIQRSVEQCTLKMEYKPVGLRACIGIGMAERNNKCHKPNHMQLIQDADLACSLARESCAEDIQIYYSKTNTNLEQNHIHSLLAQIRDAVANKRVRLLFQPIVNLNHNEHERYEALVRLYGSSSQELLSESVFAALQNNALAERLDRWVIDRSIARLTSPDAKNDSNKIFFINLSPATLKSQGLRPWLRTRLQGSELKPGQIVFEVSEITARQNFETLKGFLVEVRALGCQFSCERFQGQSESLSLARQLQPDYVKLDSKLFQNLNTYRKIVVKRRLQEMVQQLEELGITVVAAGVEDLELLPVLWSCGIECIQGFVMQPPLEEMRYDFMQMTL